MTRYTLILILLSSFFHTSAQENFHLLMDRGQIELEAGNFLSARRLLEKAHATMSEKTSDEDRAVLFNNLGLMYSSSGEYKKGINCYTLAIDYYKSLQIDSMLAETFYNLGIAYKDLGLSARATRFLLQSARICEKSENWERLSAAWNSIGNVYRDMKSFSKAIVYHRKALNLRKQINYEKGIADSYQNIGSTYLEWGHYTTAEQYLLEALERKLRNRQWNIVTTLSSLGRVYIALGKPKKALPFLSEAYEIRSEAGNLTKAAESLYYLATYYDSIGDQIKALELYHQIQSTTRQTANWQLLAETLQSEITLLETKNDSGVPVEKYKELLEVREKAAEEANRKEVERLEVEYDVERKDHQIEKQTLQNQQLIIGIVLSFLLILVVSGAWYLVKRKKDEISELHEELHHRTSNNFMILSAMLVSDEADATHEETLKVIAQNKLRLEAMAEVQHHLKTTSTRKTKVHLDSYLGKIIGGLKYLLPKECQFEFSLRMEKTYVRYATAVRLGLALNELVSNSLKHGIGKAVSPALAISVEKNNGTIRIVVQDNGPGIQKKQEMTEKIKGQKLLAQLLSGINGRIDYHNEKGCVATILVEIKNPDS